MKIHGLQKMTLLDFPGKVACTVFTAGCNFRCPFCHNASLVEGVEEVAPYAESDVLAFLESRRGLLEGVAITGGEPLLQPDIVDFLSKIKAMGFQIKLDTNGSFPEKLSEILERHLADYVAMDVKNSLSKYKETAGINDKTLEATEKSIDILLNSGVDYEFRTTVIDEYHTVEDIKEISKRIKGAKHYFLQVFRDSGDILGEETLHAPDVETLKEMENVAKDYIPAASLRGI